MTLSQILLRGAVLAPLGAALSFAVQAQTVNSFTVVNADTEADIATFQTLGAVSRASTPNINVRVNASTDTVKVIFGGQAGTRTESTQPFALKGDSAGNYFAWAPAAGTYNVTATPYNAAGAAGPTANFTLTVELQQVTLPAVSNFTIVNADTGADISTVTSAGSVSIASTPRINVRANATAPTLSVVFQEGGTSLPDSALPFAFKGDTGGVYAPWSPSVGTYIITATPYAASGGAGAAGPQSSLTLTVTNGSSAYTGNLMIDPQNPRYFVYDRDNNGDGERDPAYLAGSGGPEGFLYMKADRKQYIVNQLLKSSTLATPVNGLYFHSIRSFGGDDTTDTETPFIANTDPKSGIDPAKMRDWRTYLKQLDDAGIVLWFNLFDDHSTPYGCAYNDDYRAYARAIVNEFKDLKHLVWITQEEYRWKDKNGQGKSLICTLDQNDKRQQGLAAAIREVDSVHPIGTHHMNGAPMVFPNDPNIRVFAQQANAKSPEAMHDASGLQGWGNDTSTWVYVMAEAHTWHRDLIDAEIANGSGRTPMRRSNWATALSGGSVMMYDAYEGSSSDPSIGMLDDLRRLRQFMESTRFNRMKPLFGTTLTGRKRDGTKYMLVNDSEGQYILYTDDATATKLGLSGAPNASYELTWYDAVSGIRSVTSGTVDGNGNGSFAKPSGFGNEVAVFMRKL